MTGFNHGLTGTVIALAIKEPFLALPLAFISHFVCDVIPHFGALSYDDRIKNQKFHHKVYLIDLLLILALISILLIMSVHWYVLAAVFLAVSPDLVWIYRYFYKEKLGKVPPTKGNLLTRFHIKIQWSETVWPGALVEAIYATVMLIFLSNLL